MDSTYNRTRVERALLKAVSADHRVVAARQALDAFNASPAGRTLDAAAASSTAWANADTELKDLYGAFTYNWARTRKTVRAELVEQVHTQKILLED